MNPVSALETTAAADDTDAPAAPDAKAPKTLYEGKALLFIGIGAAVIIAIAVAVVLKKKKK